MSVVWAILAVLVAPRVIEAAYHGSSWDLFNQIITGQTDHPLQHYLDRWRQLARLWTVGLLLIGLLGHTLIVVGPRLRETIPGVLALDIREPVTRWDFLRASVCIGLLTGIGEGCYAIGRQALLRRASWDYSWEVLWMAPLGGALLFGFLGLLLLGAVALARRPGPTLQLTFLPVFYGTYLLLSSFQLRMMTYGLMLLAAGITVLYLRVVRCRARVVGRTTRWMTGALIALTLVAASGQTSLRWFGERRALINLPDPRDGPNVLLLILDTVRAQSMGLYGSARPTTPYLKRLARHATVFENAIAPSSWTLPSHATMFTGRLPIEHGADWWVPLSDRFVTLAEVLQAKGYETAGFVGNLLYTSRSSQLHRGFVHYEGHLPSLGLLLESFVGFRKLRRLLLRLAGRQWSEQGREVKSAADINDALLTWLATRRSRADRPFFVFLNYMDAHWPYLRHPALGAPFSASQVLSTPSQARNDPDTLEVLQKLYEGEIAYIDGQIERLFRLLEAQGVLGHTLVIVTSDHGEEFGENGRSVEHGKSLFYATLRVPLLIKLPGVVPEGVRVDEPVSLRDIPATVLGLIGNEPEPALPGQSLARLWKATPEGRAGGIPIISDLNRVPGKARWSLSSRTSLTSIVIGNLHYIWYARGGEELYDYVRDPWERNDLAAEADAERLAPFRKALQNYQAHGQPEPSKLSLH